jgi:sulfur carrier protein
MRILVNGDSHVIAAPTLEAALVELGFRDSIVATALNGEFVAASSRSGRQLSEGDRLEILAPMQGG